MGFPILVRWHLFIESAPWFLRAVALSSLSRKHFLWPPPPLLGLSNRPGHSDVLLHVTNFLGNQASPVSLVAPGPPLSLFPPEFSVKLLDMCYYLFKLQPTFCFPYSFCYLPLLVRGYNRSPSMGKTVFILNHPTDLELMSCSPLMSVNHLWKRANGHSLLSAATGIIVHPSNREVGHRIVHISCSRNYVHSLVVLCLALWPYQQILTHWGWVTNICIGNLTIIGSDNGLSPVRRQAIIWTNAAILSIRP